MCLDVPIFKRCCFCLALRCDLIAWAYFKLIVASLLLLHLSLTLVEMLMNIVAYEKMYFIDDAVILAITLCVLSSDLILHIIFVIGAHKKNIKFLRMYYLYNVSVLVMTFLLGFVCFSILINNRWGFTLLLLSAVSTFFVYILIQMYVVILVRCEIVKLNNIESNKFVNNEAESKITVKIVEPHEEKISSTEKNGDKKDIDDSNDITTCSKSDEICV